jgi:ribosomal protein S18 acetylase RimI-like enzyme
MTFHIRHAKPQDVVGVTACVNAAYTPYIELLGRPPGPMLDDYAVMIRDHSVFVVDGNEDDLAAVLVLIAKPDHLLLDNVAVGPPFQGQGLGGRLLHLAESQARAGGWDEIQLYTSVLMLDNIALYERVGYVEFDRRNERGLHRVFLKKSLGEAG